jgi:flagellar export protein FliJ
MPKFSLQSVLDYRHSRVEVLEVELGRLNHLRQEKLDAIAQNIANQERAYHQMGVYQSGDIDLLAVQQTQRYLSSLFMQLKKLEAELAKLDGRIEAKRLEVVQAKKDEAVLENLREREILIFKEKLNMQEKQQQDDIYTSKEHFRSRETKNSQDEEVAV